MQAVRADVALPEVVVAVGDRGIALRVAPAAPRRAVRRARGLLLVEVARMQLGPGVRPGAVVEARVVAVVGHRRDRLRRAAGRDALQRGLDAVDDRAVPARHLRPAERGVGVAERLVADVDALVVVVAARQLPYRLRRVAAVGAAVELPVRVVQRRARVVAVPARVARVVEVAVDLVVAAVDRHAVGQLVVVEARDAAGAEVPLRVDAVQRRDDVHAQPVLLDHRVAVEGLAADHVGPRVRAPGLADRAHGPDLLAEQDRRAAPVGVLLLVAAARRVGAGVLGERARLPAVDDVGPVAQHVHVGRRGRRVGRVGDRDRLDALDPGRDLRARRRLGPGVEGHERHLVVGVQPLDRVGRRVVARLHVRDARVGRVDPVGLGEAEALAVVGVGRVLVLARVEGEPRGRVVEVAGEDLVDLEGDLDERPALGIPAVAEQLVDRRALDLVAGDRGAVERRRRVVVVRVIARGAAADRRAERRGAVDHVAGGLADRQVGRHRPAAVDPELGAGEHHWVGVAGGRDGGIDHSRGERRRGRRHGEQGQEGEEGETQTRTHVVVNARVRSDLRWPNVRATWADAAARLATVKRALLVLAAALSPVLGAAPAHAACVASVRYSGATYFGSALTAVEGRSLSGGVLPGCNDVIVHDAQGHDVSPRQPDQPVALRRVRGVPARLAVDYGGRIYPAEGY